MTSDVIHSLAFIPASESLFQLIKLIIATVQAAKDVVIAKESFARLSSYLGRIVLVLEELAMKNIDTSQSLSTAIEIIEREIKDAKQLVQDCSKRNRVYLLVNCRRIIKRLEHTTRELSRALSLIPLASLDLSVSVSEEISELCETMMRMEFKAAIEQEEIMERIESGIQERNVDRSYANKLLALIAEAVGIQPDRTTLKRELDGFKTEIEEAQLRKDQAEAIQMDQIIALLGRADAASSPREKETLYMSKRNSLGTQLLEPLQSFYCPITKDVMIDPVETSSGQTFERAAIEKWLEDGNSLCPLTITPLNPNILRPNKTLQQSIQEWKDRNTMIRIGSMKCKILSDDDQEVLQTLGELQDICEERTSHLEWVVLENYIPLLIKRLGGKNNQIRNRILAILCILAKEEGDVKERILDVDSSMEFIVRSLARRRESKLAVALLLELSKNDRVRDHIGKTQGCILLLVTISSSDDNQAAKDSRELLENLSALDQNIIEMAKSNYFKPLLHRLSSGPENVKKLMARTLAEMELSDNGKSTLVEEGVLPPLYCLVSDADLEMKEVAVKALQHLSSVPRNGLQMIREGSARLLLDHLYRHSSSPRLREQVGATIMNLAKSTEADQSGLTRLSFLESDEDIFRLFSLINLTGPTVQRSILQTFHSMCEPPNATDIRSKLRQCSAIQVLVQLCELDNIRPEAVKLFCCLTQDGDEGMVSEHVDQRCIQTLLRIITTSDDEEELTAIMGIISNLPRNPSHITEWLIEEGAIPIIFRFLTDGTFNSNQIKENSVGAIRRFSVSSNQDWQMKTAEIGIIPVLVQLLQSGTSLMKQHSAYSLAQFSESSIRLSRPIERRGGFFCCSPPAEAGCPVHLGVCSVESSFCLVEADAVEPLARILGETDFEACEAALGALLTLIDGERVQSGSKVLTERNAIIPIIRLLSSPSVILQEKALLALERLFRLVEFKQKYGASAQMPLVDITQRGNSASKSLAARILAHLNVLDEQSSYF
ncbi:U-box domain-containing protein 44-like [Papaver somniferum]|uniref:U-box domain-containing protein 44-like n=1 Tax=Papaver somniferum TaxID=3469 RepID=UPI000E6FAAC0|nr:U-box domain-containing protein 44-like [Papaver somniferum]